MKNVSVSMDEKEHLKLRHICLEERTTLGRFVYAAITEKLARMEPSTAFQDDASREV